MTRRGRRGVVVMIAVGTSALGLPEARADVPAAPLAPATTTPATTVPAAPVAAAPGTPGTPVGAPAGPPKVILLRPPAVPATVSEALVRLRGELMVEGFDAEVVERALGPDTRASLERVAPTMAATALVAVVAGTDPGSAELWVVDRVTGKTVVRRVRADPTAAARIAEVLAVRAVELLRASFLELAISSRPVPEAVDAPVPTTPAVTRFATEPLEEPDWRWAVEAGGGAIGAVTASGAGVGTEFIPVGRIEHAFGPRLCARVSFAGLGTQARVATPSGGYADLSESVLLAEGLVRFRRGRRLEPIASIGVGTLRLSAEGHESTPYQAESGSRWAAAADVGVGFRVPLRPRRFELGVEAHAILAQPYPVVRFFDTEIARAGRPSLLGSVSLLGGI